MPELGLMLATLTSDLYVGPWKMVAAGTIIFLTILGFNLIGEGLRRRLDPANRRVTAWGNMRQRFSFWVDERLTTPIWAWSRTHLIHLVMLSGMVLALAVGMFWWRMNNDAKTPAMLPVPGGHLWASQRHDPAGTLQIGSQGPQEPTLIWTYRMPGPASGGPAVSADGAIYVTTQYGHLVARTAGGQNAWLSPAHLPTAITGAPALSPQGRIYATDELGGLTAVSLNGDLLWNYLPEGDRAATSGPVVDSNGVIYYAAGGDIQAVSPDGKALWTGRAQPTLVNAPPAISPDEKTLLVQDAILEAQTGKALSFDGLPKADQFLIGADGKTYLRSENVLSEISLSSDQAELVRTIDWPWQRYAFGLPRDAGVTSSGLVWLLYYSNLEDANMIWLDRDGNVLSHTRLTHRPTRMIGIDSADVAYLCGTSRIAGPECVAIQAGIEQPLWQVDLPGHSGVAGGALVEGKLYVVLEEGMLHALTDVEKAGKGEESP
jgi:outer membrane protein assembly factor BamB